VAKQLDSACREAGFFYVANHGNSLTSVTLPTHSAMQTWVCLASAWLSSSTVSSTNSGAQHSNLGVVSVVPPLMLASELRRKHGRGAGVPERVLTGVLHEAREWFGLPVCPLLLRHRVQTCARASTFIHATCLETRDLLPRTTCRGCDDGCWATVGSASPSEMLCHAIVPPLLTVFKLPHTITRNIFASVDTTQQKWR